MIRLILILLVLAIVVYLVWTLLIRAKPSESTLYSELVSRCMGDRSQAESLIEFEGSRDPRLRSDRQEKIARALRRLERDKHR